jgi:hypothetical protein
MGIHQPDQAIFKSLLPEDIDWKPFPASPRRHGWQSSSVSLPNSGRTSSGSRCPRASGAYVTQVTANGPLGLEYIDPIDDPRNN